MVWLSHLLCMAGVYHKLGRPFANSELVMVLEGGLMGGLAVFQNLADSGWFLKIAYPSFNTLNDIMVRSDVNVCTAREIQVTVVFH